MKFRRSSKSKSINIRKVSFSGSSVSSGSFSSTSSCSTIHPHDSRIPPSSMHSSSSSSSSSLMSSAASLSSSASPSSAFFDPLSLHPTFQAPLRLHQRPLIPMPEGRRYQDVSAFCDDSDDDQDLDHDDDDGPFHMELSSPDDGASALSVSTSATLVGGAQDSFVLRLAKRPQLQRSRWSESTVATMQTLDELTPVSSACSTRASIAMADGDEAACNPAFVAKRPVMRHMDSFDEFVKRGGWKRRGIVFHVQDMDLA